MLKLIRSHQSQGRAPVHQSPVTSHKEGHQGTSHQSPVTNHQSPITSHPNGFSLLEIVIALAIVTIGIVGVMIIFPAGLRAQQRAADFTTAATLGSQTLQYITARGYDAAPTPLPSTRPPTNTPLDPLFEIPVVRFDEPHSDWGRRESFIVVEPLPPPPLDPLIQVTVSIYWIDGGVREKKFITFMAP